MVTVCTLDPAGRQLHRLALISTKLRAVSLTYNSMAQLTNMTKLIRPLLRSIHNYRNFWGWVLLRRPFWASRQEGKKRKKKNLGCRFLHPKRFVEKKKNVVASRKTMWMKSLFLHNIVRYRNRKLGLDFQMRAGFDVEWLHNVKKT